eukprot:g44558.t1
MWKQTKLERVHTDVNKKSKVRSGSAISVSQRGKVEFRRKSANLRSRSTGWLHRYQRRPASNNSKVLDATKAPESFLPSQCQSRSRASHTSSPSGPAASSSAYFASSAQAFSYFYPSHQARRSAGPTNSVIPAVQAHPSSSLTSVKSAHSKHPARRLNPIRRMLNHKRKVMNAKEHDWPGDEDKRKVMNAKEHDWPGDEDKLVRRLSFPSMTEMLRPTTEPVIRLTPRSQRRDLSSDSRSRSRSRSWNSADDDVHSMPTAQSAEDLKGRAHAAKYLKAVVQDVVEKPLSAEEKVLARAEALSWIPPSPPPGLALVATSVEIIENHAFLPATGRFQNWPAPRPPSDSPAQARPHALSHPTSPRSRFESTSLDQQHDTKQVGEQSLSWHEFRTIFFAAEQVEQNVKIRPTPHGSRHPTPHGSRKPTPHGSRNSSPPQSVHSTPRSRHPTLPISPPLYPLSPG